MPSTQYKCVQVRHKYGNVIMLFIMSDFLPDTSRFARFMGTYCIHEYNRLLPVARYAYHERVCARARPPAIADTRWALFKMIHSHSHYSIAFGGIRIMHTDVASTAIDAASSTINWNVIDTKRMNTDSIYLLPHIATYYYRPQFFYYIVVRH